ncbi:exodeoxyribonuclease VII small subunit [Kineosphaera limosa]|uniref:Exodeoxyribonuclease 7 small subunit n=1 Tax=Kineosphaera limosa NBRC 100340 TaxID=1184609 RepID=K6WA50_9MICO|nr:exodeoxyribonuclease VII small subunit [Kineosphaera limosa]NYE02392.1 exodeoxyribonuclease VII small subunit [Kineosphaera limosa]GAB96080.1 exodeoxyribonuclease VII small subunit [Kineosphaera limosa NBRC 100340]
MTDPSTDRSEAELAAVSTLTYEQARDELVAIVARLESGQLDLEASMALWQRGESLADHCTRWLDGAQAQLQGEAPDDEQSAGSRPPADSDTDEG